MLIAATVSPFAAFVPAIAAAGTTGITLSQRLAALEQASGGRLGVAAVQAATGAPLVAHRADERFPFCSTFKMMLSAAVLSRSETEPRLLQRRLPYGREHLISHSPVTEKHAGAGMTVAELCAATLQYSDNTAANLLIDLLGGPAAVTAFARGIGDDTFRLDRTELSLNTAIPGDPRDTTTPLAMARSLQRLAVGDALGAPHRKQLMDWMLGNTTGAERIRAGVAADWAVADKTGTGSYGTTNDIAVILPPGKPPVVLTVYFTQRDAGARARNDVIASATRIAIEALA